MIVLMVVQSNIRSHAIGNRDTDKYLLEYTLQLAVISYIYMSTHTSLDQNE